MFYMKKFSVSLIRLSCRLNVNIFENEHFYMGFEVAGTGGNHTTQVERINQL